MYFSVHTKLFGAVCLFIQTIVDVLSILNWVETLYMSLQYIFKANKAPFISSTFIWLFDSSTLQCPPAECPLYVAPQPVKHASEKISILGSTFWSIILKVLILCSHHCNSIWAFLSKIHMLSKFPQVFSKAMFFDWSKYHK